MFAMVDTLPATALAAMAAVPRVEVSELTQSLPIWNMPFSSPEGTPMARMRPTSSRRGSRSAGSDTRSGFSICCCWTSTHTAATTRPNSVASAAPSTPRPKP